MTNEQQEIDNYITHVDEAWSTINSSMDVETRKVTARGPILDLASFLQSKGHRPADICNEIIHLLKTGLKKGVIVNKIGNPPTSLELMIHGLLKDTLFQPSVNLMVYDSYTKDFGSKKPIFIRT